MSQDLLKKHLQELFLIEQDMNLRNRFMHHPPRYREALVSDFGSTKITLSFFSFTLDKFKLSKYVDGSVPPIEDPLLGWIIYSSRRFK